MSSESRPILQKMVNVPVVDSTIIKFSSAKGLGAVEAKFRYPSSPAMNVPTWKLDGPNGAGFDADNSPAALQLYWQRGQAYTDVTQVGDGHTVLFSPTLAHTSIEPGSVTLTCPGSASLQDDGNGHFFDGAGGQFASGTINYATGVCAITYVTAPANLAVLTINYTAWLNITSTYTPLPPVLNELVGTGTGAALTFSHTTAQNPIVPGTLVVDAGVSGVYQDNGAGAFNQAFYAEAYSAGSASLLTFTHTLATPPAIPKSLFIYVTGVLVAQDDGAGHITGSNAGGPITGTITYSTGVCSITFTAAPGVHPITFNYLSSSAAVLTAGSVVYTTGVITGLTFASAPATRDLIVCSYVPGVNSHLVNPGGILRQLFHCGSELLRLRGSGGGNVELLLYSERHSGGLNDG
jgi:hypothetical protein